MHFGSDQGDQSYCCFFSTHPDDNLDVMRTNNSKTDLTEQGINGCQNALERKIVCNSIHNIVQKS